MKQRRYTSEGVILKRTNYSEADRILVIYTRHFGKVRLIAKGVRKPKSKKRGALEVFTYLKFSASKGKDLDIMTETEIINNYVSLRNDLKKTAVAYFFIEVIERLTRDDIKSVELLDMLCSYMESLDESKTLRKLRNDFVHDVLVTLGFWPHDKELTNPDTLLEEILESKLRTPAIGRKILS